jgi:hypothetical protein
LTVLRAPHLIFERIKLDSSLEITLAAARSTGLVIYALHLLCAVLGDPERIGGWLGAEDETPEDIREALEAESD